MCRLLGSVKVTLDCARGDSHELGDLAVGVPCEVVDQDDALSSRDSAQDSCHEPPHVEPAVDVIRRQPPEDFLPVEAGELVVVPVVLALPRLGDVAEPAPRRPPR